MPGHAPSLTAQPLQRYGTVQCYGGLTMGCPPPPPPPSPARRPPLRHPHTGALQRARGVPEATAVPHTAAYASQGCACVALPTSPDQNDDPRGLSSDCNVIRAPCPSEVTVSGARNAYVRPPLPSERFATARTATATAPQPPVTAAAAALETPLQPSSPSRAALGME